ncbi:hypothetical protein HHK36_030785 [Tetracentron sinense]|uniref:Uncharacterized protein n=1 Tax=Tetracentron sinense TaxID=13715 RepID=A0A834Y878_TETSI|nr:hypothetical protein HHK36_030785 [Tetracentron sinense]
MGSMNIQSNLASSIESLSSINHDLHWKLQQQRLAMLFGGENQKENGSVSSVTDTLLENHTQKPQPLLFQNLDISNTDVCAGLGESPFCLASHCVTQNVGFHPETGPNLTVCS